MATNDHPATARRRFESPEPPPRHFHLPTTTAATATAGKKLSHRDSDAYYATVRTVQMREGGSSKKKQPLVADFTGPSSTTTGSMNSTVSPQGKESRRTSFDGARNDGINMSSGNGRSDPAPSDDRRSSRGSSILLRNRMFKSSRQQQCPITIPQRTSSVNLRQQQQRDEERRGGGGGGGGGQMFSSLDGTLALSQSRSTPVLRRDPFVSCSGAGGATRESAEKGDEGRPSTPMRQQPSAGPGAKVAEIHARTASAASQRSNTGYSLFPRLQTTPPRVPTHSLSSSSSSSTLNNPSTAEWKADEKRGIEGTGKHGPGGVKGLWRAFVPVRWRSHRGGGGRDGGRIIEGGREGRRDENVRRPGSSWSCLGFGGGGNG